MANGGTTVLAGGVGGSKLVEGLALAAGQEHLTVIGNVGDDIERHGLWVSPDLDIVTYTLSGLIDRERGWGFEGETFRTLEALARLGESTWMNLGDQDLATHILRTRLRREGVRPTEIAQRIARQLGVKTTVLPPTDDPLQTRVETPDGVLDFQTFFLRERCEPEILGVTYAGATAARPTPEVLRAIEEADVLVIAPSNPLASIGPILAVPGVREAVLRTRAFRIAVSPLVGGRSLKGPSDRMLRAEGFSADAIGVAACYGNLLQGLVIDHEDAGAESDLRKRGLEVLVTNTVMGSVDDRARLAAEVLAFAAARS